MLIGTRKWLNQNDPNYDPNPTPEDLDSSVSEQEAAAPLPPGVRGGDKIVDQIESKADYVSPSVYHMLLSYYSSYEPETDANTSFESFSQTKVNPKLFVIGLIPPSANVTRRRLDRSASLGKNIEELDFSGDRAVGGQGGTGGSGEAGQGGGGVGATGWVGELNGVTVVRRGRPPTVTHPRSFWVKYVQMCQRHGIDPMALAPTMEAESNFNPSAQNILKDKNGNEYVAAQGLNQLTWSVAKNIGKPKGKGMTREQWNTYATLSAEDQLYWVEKYVRTAGMRGKTALDIYRRNFGGHPQTNPAGVLYFSKEAYDKLSPGDKERVKDPKGQDRACHDNPGFVDADGRITLESLAKAIEGRPKNAATKAAIEDALTSCKPPPPPLPKDPPPGPGTNGAWQGIGSAQAATAKETEAKVANKDLNTTELGKAYQAAQQAEADMTSDRLNQMRNTPPLRLLVNPKSFKISSEKIASDGNWSRNGPIVEHWGDQQDKIEASGTLAAFFAIDEFGEGPGLTRVARNFSEGYQNFLSLYMFYRNNGYLFVEVTETEGEKSISRLSLVGSIYIYYDNILYVGSFDNFNITETADKPYTLEYSFQFTVRATFLLDRSDAYEQEISMMGREGLVRIVDTPRG